MSYGNRGPRPLFHGRGGPRFRPYGAVPPYWMGQARGGFGPRFGGPRYGYPDTYHEDYGPEPPFGEPGPGPYGDGVPPVGGAPPVSEALNDVKDWLARAPPGLVRHMYHHCKFLLEKMGVPLEDPQVPPGPSFQRASSEGPGGGTFADDDVDQDYLTGNMGTWYTPFKPVGGPGGPTSIADLNAQQESHQQQMPGKPPAAKKAEGRPHFGLGYNKNSANLTGEIQWTPDGWAPKDNSHKVTTQMRPLPKLDMIPPQSTTYPEASSDRDKLKMLKNNVNMMTIELNKICNRFKIKQLDREDISMYPENQQDKLRTAITCVGNAEKTLEDYQCFLKTEKYKQWNEDQETKRQEAIKNMIGETPEGVPHKRPASDENEEEEEEEDQGHYEEAETENVTAETDEEFHGKLLPEFVTA